MPQANAPEQVATSHHIRTADIQRVMSRLFFSSGTPLPQTIFRKGGKSGGGKGGSGWGGGGWGCGGWGGGGTGNVEDPARGEYGWFLY